MLKLEEIEDSIEYSVVPKGRVRNIFMTGKEVKEKVNAGQLEIKHLGPKVIFFRDFYEKVSKEYKAYK